MTIEQSIGELQKSPLDAATIMNAAKTNDPPRDGFNAAKLVPRKFKIEQGYNSYVYFVEHVYELDKWAVSLGGCPSMYLTKWHLFDYPGHDTAVFDNPEAALEFWKSFMAVAH